MIIGIIALVIVIISVWLYFFNKKQIYLEKRWEREMGEEIDTELEREGYSKNKDGEYIYEYPEFDKNLEIDRIELKAKNIQRNSKLYLELTAKGYKLDKDGKYIKR